MIKMPVAFYLGIDAGGTKVHCAVGNEQRILAAGTGGAGSLLRAGAVTVRTSLHDAITSACAHAQVKPDQVVGACLGATGAADPDVAQELQNILQAILPSAVIDVRGDMEIALTAAFGDGPGVVVVSGTGSIAFGRTEHGLIARAGGLGPLTSDEGSGYWIGKRALGFLPVGDGVALPAELVPAVIAEAEIGNASAQAVLDEAGCELAKLAAQVCGELFSASQRIDVAVTGGVFQHAQRLRESFAEHVARLVPQAIVELEAVDPVQGALWVARRMTARSISS